MSNTSLCGHTRARTSRSSKMAISQSSSLENWSRVHFMSLAIAFSSLASSASPLLIEEEECAWDRREGVGDGDLDGDLDLLGVILGARVDPAALLGACVDPAAGLTDRFDRWVLRLGYFDASVRVRPYDGRFQYVWSPKPLSSFFCFLRDMLIFLTIPIVCCSYLCFRFDSGLLLPAVTSLLCREPRRITVKSLLVNETGDDQSLVLVSRSLRNQTDKKQTTQITWDRRSDLGLRWDRQEKETKKKLISWL